MRYVEYRENPNMRQIAEAICQDEALAGRLDKVAFLLQNQPVGGKTRAKWFLVKIVDLASASLHGYEVIISVFEGLWDTLTDAQRLLITDLALSSLKVSDNGKITKCPPDAILQSVEVLRRHQGVSLPDLGEVIVKSGA